MRKRIYMQALDPVHVGTGGQRLGGVDNTIVRDPATNLPKIPGTTFHGAVRHYDAYYAADKSGKKEYLKCAGQVKVTSDSDHIKGCPICFTFGRPDSPKGIVNIFDAQVLFFAVRSMHGPVWVATPRILDDYGISVLEVKESEESQGYALMNLSPGSVYTTIGKQEIINLGWKIFTNPKMCKLEGVSPLPDTKVSDLIQSRIVVVDEASFAQVVNSNLEVRTSVAINPETGAAEETALFTYEAIPRGTIMAFEVTWDKYRKSEFPKNKEIGWSSPEELLETGLSLIETLGVGGIGTRGFGRLKWLKGGES